LLKEKIKVRIEALLKKGEQLRQLAESDPVAPREGLSQPELAVMAALAGDAVLPDSTSSTHSLLRDVERAGFTSIGFGLGIRRLVKKELIEIVDEQDFNGEDYQSIKLASAGWDWIDDNNEMFTLKKAPARPQPAMVEEGFDDDIPF
jgi:hypothetical protein